jgi:hypothetical protein
MAAESQGVVKLFRLLALALFATSCEAPQTGGAPLRDVTPQEFGKMRWLTGTWRGQIRSDDESDTPFYERWVAIDDSTLAMHRFSDSALTVPRDSARVELRGGSIHYRDAKRTMPSTGLASRAAIFFPEGEERGGVTFNTQVPCGDTLALATARCYHGVDSTKAAGRFWWSALWHTAPVLLGRETPGGEHLVYNPPWRRSTPRP